MKASIDSHPFVGELNPSVDNYSMDILRIMLYWRHPSRSLPTYENLS